MELLDGKKLSQEFYSSLKKNVAELKSKNIVPKLVIILVGDDPASLSYIGSKTRACEQVGVESETIKLEPSEVSTEILIKKIQELNADNSVTGILVQLPLPEGVYVPDVLKAIDPQKDVDGFTAYNLGKMFLSTEFEDLAPCTPQGILRLLEKHNVEIEGAEVVVVGRSNVVGKPVAVMLLNRGATVTVCHSKTKDLAAHTVRADILVVAVGKADLVNADMVKDDAVVVDVGINRGEDGKLRGDVDFDAVSKKSSYISPVPGGCGPMTVACLLENVVRAARKQHLT